MSAGISEIERLLAAGQVATVRERLRQLAPRERALLSDELGKEPLVRAERSATVVARGPKRGRVVVVPGIMGSLLDARRGGPGERVWLSVLRLARGRFGDLELAADGATTAVGREVEVAGLHRSYLPLVLHLDQHWDVLPFAYDWRMSIDASADLLARRIEEWARGGTVHIVAHSMGGLVARSLSLRYPELWAAMGGRLVMLGTPNRGSYAIALTLIGQERLVKLLSLVDVFHDRREIGRVLGTFPGPYELLPAPGAEVDDDRERLYSPEAWGGSGVSRRHLDRAREFHTQMTEVIDPQRLVYIAGYGRRTPHLVRVVASGELELSATRSGDGRVSHALGLLDDVETYYADAGHGSLPRAASVLDGLGPLLAYESPGSLATQAPEARGAEAPEWIPAAEFDAEPDPEELDAELRSIRLATRGSDDRPAPDDALAEARVAREMARDYLGEPTSDEAVAAARGGRAAVTTTTTLHVAWGDIAEMDDCDVVAVGHYQGMLPQYAELALDQAMSAGAGHLLITEQARRGLVRGDPGTVTFLPWPSPTRPGRVVAVCGMGRPGTFDATRLRRLVQNLIWACASLPGEGRLCSVLIGSGEGTQTIEQAVVAWIEGASDAARAGLHRPLASITIVERDRRRARRALAAFHAKAGGGDGLVVEADALQPEAGGAVGAEDAFALAVALVARALREGAAKPDRAAAVRLLKGLPLDAERAREVRAALSGLAADSRTIDEVAQSLDVSRRSIVSARDQAAEGSDTAERMSFIASEEGIRAAAITNTTTVPERLLQPGTLIQELAERMTKELGDPGGGTSADRVGELGEFLCALVVPNEFERIIESAGQPLVVEVDRTTGQLHWETLPGGERPMAVSRPTARQLRTTRSPAPAPPRPRTSTLRVLIIGDPGPPSEGLSLEGARREALEVYERLSGQEGVETVALIGSPSGPESGFPPADRLTALMQLLNGDYDIVHYTGHGDYDPRQPDRAGWLFEGGKITAREFRNADHLPALIVANACLTGRIAGGGDDGRTPATPLSEAALLPSLADAFFQYGVRDYIGTAWEVSDAGAVLFAQTLYSNLLNGESIGASVRAARERLWTKRDRFGSLWVAYQHYGDPTSGNVIRPATSRAAARE